MSLEVEMSNANKQKKPKYTLEFKQDAAKIVLKNGYTRQRAADHLGVSLSAISRLKPRSRKALKRKRLKIILH